MTRPVFLAIATYRTRTLCGQHWRMDELSVDVKFCRHTYGKLVNVS